MERTPLRERKLPDYTRGEEITNMVTHIVGAALSLPILIGGVILSAYHRDPWAIVGSCVYGLTMLWLYTMSSVYHGLHDNTGKRVLQVLDHCTIYALIAGTYTPILLVAIRPEYPALAWTLFGCEWGLGAAAAAMTAIDLKKYGKASMACYVAMGWLIVLALRPTLPLAACRRPGLYGRRSPVRDRKEKAVFPQRVSSFRPSGQPAAGRVYSVLRVVGDLYAGIFC